MVVEPNNSLLILPGDPWFEITLALPPPNWKQVAAKDGNTYAFVASASNGLLRPVTSKQLEEYLEGGEYTERLKEVDGMETDSRYLHF